MGIVTGSKGHMRDLIDIFKALSDETRLRIIHALLQRDCCVCEIMQALNISQTRASRNLGILQKSGLLKTARDGTWIIYSIDRETANRHAKALAGLLEKTAFNGEIYARDIERLKTATRVSCLQDTAGHQCTDD